MPTMDKGRRGRISPGTHLVLVGLMALGGAGCSGPPIGDSGHHVDCSPSGCTSPSPTPSPTPTPWPSPSGCPGMPTPVATNDCVEAANVDGYCSSHPGNLFTYCPDGECPGGADCFQTECGCPLASPYDSPAPSPSDGPKSCGWYYNGQFPDDPMCAGWTSGMTCSSYYARRSCLESLCDSHCSTSCVDVQAMFPNAQWQCETATGDSQCISNGYWYCPCDGTAPPAPQWTADCSDDFPSCNFSFNPWPPTLCDPFDGSCDSYNDRGDCLMNGCEGLQWAGGQPICQGTCMKLQTGGADTCLDDAGNPQCIPSGYVYCLCPGSTPPSPPWTSTCSPSPSPSADMGTPPSPDMGTPDMGGPSDMGATDMGPQCCGSGAPPGSYSCGCNKCTYPNNSPSGVSLGIPNIDISSWKWLNWLEPVIGVEFDVSIPNSLTWASTGDCKSAVSPPWDEHGHIKMTLLDKSATGDFHGTWSGSYVQTPNCPGTCDQSCNRTGTCGDPSCYTMEGHFSGSVGLQAEENLCSILKEVTDAVEVLVQALDGETTAPITLAATEFFFEHLFCPFLTKILGYFGIKMPTMKGSASIGAKVDSNMQKGNAAGCCKNLNRDVYTGTLGAGFGATTGSISSFLPWPASRMVSGGWGASIGACISGSLQSGTACDGSALSASPSVSSYVYYCIACDIHVSQACIPFTNICTPTFSCDSNGNFGGTMTIEGPAGTTTAPACFSVASAGANSGICPQGFTPAAASTGE